MKMKINMDNNFMNPKERILAAVRGDAPPDQVPAAPYIGNYGAALAEVPLCLYNNNGKLMAEAQLRALELHGLDAVVAQSDNYYIAEGFGTKISRPHNDTPHAVKNAIDTLDEIDLLKVPDPYKDGRMPVYIEAVSVLKRELKGRAAVRGCGTGPFSLAGHIIGMENFLVEIAMCEVGGDKEAEEKIMRLMSLTTDALAAFSMAMLEAGADFVICGDSAASPDLIPASYYLKYALPFEQRFFDFIAPECRKRGAVSLLHICGGTSSILPHMARSGADILEIDHKVDLGAARKAAGDDICLMGNLDPAGVLLRGTPEQVYEESLSCIEKAGKNGRFILGSGCEVAMAAPLENIRALKEAAASYKY
jgi:uroporphyrinogen decarboxylase